MAANTSPIYSLTPKINGVVVTAALAISDGSGGTTGTNIFIAYTAGVNGSYVSVLRWNPVAVSAPIATNACVGRIFISTLNTGGAGTTNANTWLFGEYTLASQSADNNTTATYCIEVPIYKALPANYSILVSNSLNPTANSYWEVVVYGGDY